MKVESLKRRLAELGCSFEESYVELPPNSKKYFTVYIWRRVDPRSQPRTGIITVDLHIDGDNVPSTVVKSICSSLRLDADDVLG